MVIVIDLIDEYSLKTNILYIGMKLRFSFLWVNFANHWLFEFFVVSIFSSCISKNTLRVFNFTSFTRNLWKFIPTKISTITVTFTPHVHQEVIAFWWTQGCNGYGCQVQLWIALIQQKHMKILFFPFIKALIWG